MMIIFHYSLLHCTLFPYKNLFLDPFIIPSKWFIQLMILHLKSGLLYVVQFCQLTVSVIVVFGTSCKQVITLAWLRPPGLFLFGSNDATTQWLRGANSFCNWYTTFNRTAFMYLASEACVPSGGSIEQKGCTPSERNSFQRALLPFVRVIGCPV